MRCPKKSSNNWCLVNIWNIFNLPLLSFNLQHFLSRENGSERAVGSHRYAPALWGQCSPLICGAWYCPYGVHGNIVVPSLSGVHGGPLGEQIVSSGGVARSALVGYLHFGGLHSGELHWPITGTW